MDTPVPASATDTDAPITFKSVIESFPYTPNTEEGKGFLPVLARSLGHVLYLVGRYEEKVKPTTAKAQEELTGARTHWDNLTVDNSFFSEKSKGEITTIGTALELAIASIESWDNKEAADNTQILANRMVQLMANLDREVLGLRGSDAGFSL